MSDFAPMVFSLVCGQNPAHTWLMGNETLPCCQRCTGLYFGAAIALILHLGLRPRPNRRWEIIHGMLLLQMVPFGFHLIPHGALARMITGELFGVGVVAYLLLQFMPVQGRAQNHDKRMELVYLALAAASLILAPLLVLWGGLPVYWLVNGWLLFGLAGLALLAGANLVCLAASVYACLRQAYPHPTKA